MKGKEDLNGLLDFYLFSDLDDKVEVDKYLEENYIDIDTVSENLAEFLRTKRAELLLADGRKFKEAYLNAMNKTIANNANQENNGAISNYSYAARNADDGDDDLSDIELNKRKLELIKHLTGKKKQ